MQQFLNDQWHTHVLFTQKLNTHNHTHTKATTTSTTTTTTTTVLSSPLRWWTSHSLISHNWTSKREGLWFRLDMGANDSSKLYHETHSLCMGAAFSWHSLQESSAFNNNISIDVTHARFNRLVLQLPDAKYYGGKYLSLMEQKGCWFLHAMLHVTK